MSDWVLYPLLMVNAWLLFRLAILLVLWGIGSISAWWSSTEGEQ